MKHSHEHREMSGRGARVGRGARTDVRGSVAYSDLCTTQRSRGRSSNRRLDRASLVTADLFSKYPKASTHCHTHAPHTHTRTVVQTGEAAADRLSDRQRSCGRACAHEATAARERGGSLGRGWPARGARSERRRRGRAVASPCSSGQLQLSARGRLFGSR